MSSAYPIDNSFRRPVELISAGVAFAAAVLVPVMGLAAPLRMGAASTVVASLSLVGLGIWRSRQAWRLMRFQRNLRLLQTYEVTSATIPHSRTELFLGRGFWWTQKHTQRLTMARLPQYEHLRARNSGYLRARQYCRENPDAWLTRLLNWRNPWNPYAPLPPVEGDPAIHGIELDEREIWTPLAERVGHTLVLGTTRVGKTRLAELLITQDIRRGDVVIVFDPKGDVALLKRMKAEASRAGRSKDFYFFHLGFPELSDRYSPISTYGRITEVATRVANPLPGEGNSAAFKQFVWLYINIIAKAASALGMNPTYTLIYRYAADLDSLALKYFELWLDKEHPTWRSDKEENDLTISEKMMQSRIQQTGRMVTIIELMDLIQKKGWNDPVADGLLSVLSNSKSKYQALINSLFPLLEKLTTGKISELLSPDWTNVSDQRRTFDWDRIMNTNAIVYVGLDALSDHEVAAAVGNAMFADLTSTAGRRYKFGTSFGQGQGQGRAVEDSSKVSIHADEFNELIGDEFIPLLNKAGGAGYQVTAYTQTWSDVEAKIGSASKAQQIGGNLNTLIMLRVKSLQTAEYLTKQLPRVEVKSLSVDSRTSDIQDPTQFADFASGAGDRISVRETEMVQPADLTQLPKGQAFALLEGGQLAKIRLPLAMPEPDDPHWPANLQAVFDKMQAQYERHAADDGDLVDFDGNPQDELLVRGKGAGF